MTEGAVRRDRPRRPGLARGPYSRAGLSCLSCSSWASHFASHALNSASSRRIAAERSASGIASMLAIHSTQKGRHWDRSSG